MTIKEFREKLKGARIKPDTELMIHVEDGDFPVSVLEYDRRGKILRICTDGWEKKSQYRVIYTILKDHEDIACSSEYSVFASTDEEVLLEFDELKDKILARHGIEGEKNEKSGSTAMEVADWEYTVEKDAVVRKPTKKTHYFTCEISEILKIVDEENDVYMRVWHDGRAR